MTPGAFESSPRRPGNCCTALRRAPRVAVGIRFIINDIINVSSSSSGSIKKKKKRRPARGQQCEAFTRGACGDGVGPRNNYYITLCRRRVTRTYIITSVQKRAQVKTVNAKGHVSCEKCLVSSSRKRFRAALDAS